MADFILKTTVAHMRTALRIVDPLKMRSHLPVLSMVHFKDGTLTATDLDMAITTTVAVTETTGEALVPYRELKSLVDGLPADENICLQTDKGALVASFSSGSYRLPTIETTDFPHFTFEIEHFISDIPKKFPKAIRFALSCKSTEETRYYLNGVCLSADKEGNPVAVGTDGHRLAAHPLGFNPHVMTGSIIPTQAAKIIANLPPPLRIETSANKRMAFVYAGMTVYTKLIDGTFPDWTRLAHTATAEHHQITIQRAPLLQALRRMNALLNVSSTYTGICLAVHENRLCLACKTHDGHEAREYLQLNELPDPISTVPAYNGKYLQSLAHLIQGDEITFQFNSDCDPAIVFGIDEGKCLIMPMRADSDYTKSILASLYETTKAQQVAA